MVRLVRACGSKQVNSVDAVELIGVRLVRACGSKLTSLTVMERQTEVRLVRACGSKQSHRRRGCERL